MINITGELHDENFNEWANAVRSNFQLMVQTMINVAELIELNTQWRVPLETQRLEKSFKYTVTENTSEFIEVELGYDAADPKSGFVYAEYQHEHPELHHPRRGEAFYLFKGIKSSIADGFELIERDYLSLFGGRL